MDEKTAYGVVRDKLYELVQAAEAEHLSVEVARAIYGGLPDGHEDGSPGPTVGTKWNELGEAITQYDVAVDAAARGQT